MEKTIVNADDYNEKFWKYNYAVHMTAQGIGFLVNADCEQDAIDEIIDYMEKTGNFPGILMTDEEVEELRAESIADYGDERYLDDSCIQGGNHGRYIHIDGIVSIEEV